MTAAIDWGNSNTVISFNVGGSEHIFRHSGSPFFPSYSYYDKNGKLASIGMDAKNRLSVRSGYVVSGIKRLIGVTYDQQVINLGRLYGLEMKPSLMDGRVLIRVGDQTWKDPEEIAVEYFAELVSQLESQARDATSRLGRILGRQRIGQCAATHPAHYIGSQSTMLRRCIVHAGFELADNGFIPEPVAARRSRKDRTHKRTLVIDWGGGTLDFALTDSEGICEHLDACQDGCGGIDMDHAIIKDLQKEKRLPMELSDTDFAVTRIVVEQMKEELLSAKQTKPVTMRVLLPECGLEVDLNLSCEELQGYIRPLLERAKSGIRSIRFQIGREKRPDECILVGGPFRSPYIAAEIRKAVGKIPIADVDNPMTAVSVGALRSIASRGGDGLVPPIVPHDYGFTVDLAQHKMGPLLICSQSISPTESPEKEIELWGIQGQPIKCSLWVRKADPTTCTDVYERSAEFSFLPTFDNGHKANIRVQLAADHHAVITAKVVDVATNQEMNLRQVSAGLSKAMAGPPCRTKLEIAGLEMLKCWRAYNHNRMAGNGLMSLLFGPELSTDIAGDGQGNNVDMEHSIKHWLGFPSDDMDNMDHSKDDTDYRDRAERLAKRTIKLVEDEIDVSDRSMTNAIKALKTLFEGNTDTSDAATIKLTEALLPLYVFIVQKLGKTKVVEQLRNLDRYESDNTFKSSIDRLAHLFSLFSERQYQPMIVACSEIKNDLMTTGMNDLALEVFELIETIMHLRGDALYIKEMLNIKKRSNQCR